MATRFVITPFVGVVPHPYDFRPSPDEVDLIFTVPLGRLESPTRSAGSCGTSAAARCRSTSTRSTATSSGARRKRITQNLLAVLGELS